MAAVMRRTRRLIDARIGARVARRRTELELSRADLARSLGLSEAELTVRETGASSFQAAEIVSLAEILNVTPGWFFEKLDTNPSEFPFEE